MSSVLDGFATPHKVAGSRVYNETRSGRSIGILLTLFLIWLKIMATEPVTSNIQQCQQIR